MQAVVGRAVHLDHVEALLDQVDERQEQLAVEAVLVEVARRAVGRGDDAYAALDQMFEQSRQDHGVGGVVHDHLVEAEQLHLVGNVLRNALQRIAFLILALVAKARVGFEHEGVEVDAALRLHVDMVEGEVHQHRLAPADAAPQVDPGKRGLLLAEQLAEQARPAVLQLRRKPIERRDRALLRRIGLELPCPDQFLVGAAYRPAHAGAFRSLMRFSVPVKL